MTHEEAREQILRTALSYANSDPRKPPYLGGETFMLPNKLDTLELWYDTQVVTGAIEAAQKFKQEERQPEEVIAELRVIVQDAIRQAVHMEPEAFTTIMLEDIRAAATRTDSTV